MAESHFLSILQGPYSHKMSHNQMHMIKCYPKAER